MTFRGVLRVLVMLLFVGWPATHSAAALATDKGTAPAATERAPAQHGESSPSAKGEHEEGSVLPVVARLLNFAILAGVLVYFFRTPIAEYLTSRSSQIRGDLVAAAEMRRAAAAELEEIDRRMKSLPAELDALKARGAEDVRAEQARIAQTAAAERERLLAQTRREIEMRLRIARRELAEYAAELSVSVAEERIKRTITPEDQLRLIDRYSHQLQEAQ
jgi:F-type H+-transporting ATPase subunit b